VLNIAKTVKIKNRRQEISLGSAEGEHAHAKSFSSNWDSDAFSPGIGREFGVESTTLMRLIRSLIETAAAASA
jgi:hypothetical protein